MLWRHGGRCSPSQAKSAERSNSLQLALKLDPMLEPKFVFDLAVAYYLARRHEDALRTAERGLARYSDFPMFNAPAAAAAAQLGRKEQAARYVEALRRRVPFLDLGQAGVALQGPVSSRVSAGGAESGRLVAGYCDWLAPRM